ncbi:hypothetical protein AWB71_02882 [Caballeronia peredens]|nr:hypothetical protein AWB71_02882 [Caballeronia peredens]
MIEVSNSVPVRTVFASLKSVKPFERLSELEAHFGTSLRATGGVPVRLALAAARDGARAVQRDLFDFAPAASVISLVHELGPEESPQIAEALADVIPNFECFRWNISSLGQYQQVVNRFNEDALIPVLNLSLSSDQNVGWVDPHDGLVDVASSSFRLTLRHYISRSLDVRQRLSVLMAAVRYLQVLALAGLSEEQYGFQPGWNIISALIEMFEEEDVRELIYFGASQTVLLNAIQSLMTSANSLEFVGALDSPLLQLFSPSTIPAFFSKLNNLVNQPKFSGTDATVATWPCYVWSWKFESRFPICEPEFMSLVPKKCMKEFEEMSELKEKKIERFGRSVTHLDESQQVVAASPNIFVLFEQSSTSEYSDDTFGYVENDKFVFAVLWVPTSVLKNAEDSDISVLVYVSFPEPELISIPYAVSSERFDYGGRHCRKLNIRLNFSDFLRTRSSTSPSEKGYRVSFGLIIEKNNEFLCAGDNAI